MPRYGKYIKDTIAYDPRSGFKVRLDDMVEDGENPGLVVAFDEADELNMQRFPAAFFPEGVLRRSFPPAERETVTMRVGQIYEGDPSFSLIIAKPAYGGGSTPVTAFITSTQVVTYLGENVTYQGEAVTYTEVTP
jgi:hypothetical protein